MNNIILITVDSLRADHCGFLTSGPSLTPNLDKITKEGLVFENAVAPAPRTPTSIPTTLTGRHMDRSSADGWGDQMDRIRRHIVNYLTISERLADIGYRTIAHTANPWTSRYSGFDKIFHEFDKLDDRDPSRLANLGLKLFGGTHIGDVIHHAESFRKKRGSFTQWPVIIEKVLDKIQAVKEPFFFWLFLMDTHNPYLVPRKDRIENTTLEMYYAFLRGNTKFQHSEDDSFLKDNMGSHLEKRVKRAYRDAVRSIDRFFDSFMEAINFDDSVLLFHSDHGEAFNEHGTYGHQQSLYEENIHVPLFVWGDSEVEATRIKRPISLSSLPNLIQHYSGSTYRPIHDLLHDKNNVVIARTESADKLAVRGERWKYIVANGYEELYDLDSDPKESEDVSTANKSICNDMNQIADCFCESLEDSLIGSKTKVSIPETITSRLESLGYKE